MNIKIFLNLKFRWNITRRRKIEGTDGYFLSLPKSGRTYFRTFLSKYYESLTGNGDFSFNLNNYPSQKKIIFGHDRWDNAVMWGWYDWIRGKGFISRVGLTTHPTVLLVRDPRDVVVSLFFQLTKRHLLQAAADLDLSRFIHHEIYGINFIVTIMNIWIDELTALKSNFLIVSYEECRLDPNYSFSRILEFYGVKIDNDCLQSAIKFSDFNNVKILEKNNAFNESELRATNVHDNDSFKARRGIVGGYVDYFDSDDIDYLNASMERLNPIFGYNSSLKDDSNYSNVS